MCIRHHPVVDLFNSTPSRFAIFRFNSIFPHSPEMSYTTIYFDLFVFHDYLLIHETNYVL